MAELPGDGDRRLWGTRSLLSAAAVTPGDSDLNLLPTSALWIGGAGNLTVQMAAPSGEIVTFTGVPAGTWLWIVVRQVRATGTTATNIVALY